MRQERPGGEIALAHDLELGLSLESELESFKQMLRSKLDSMDEVAAGGLESESDFEAFMEVRKPFKAAVESKHRWHHWTWRMSSRPSRSSNP